MNNQIYSQDNFFLNQHDKLNNYYSHVINLFLNAYLNIKSIIIEILLSRESHQIQLYLFPLYDYSYVLSLIYALESNDLLFLSLYRVTHFHPKFTLNTHIQFLDSLFNIS